LEGRLVEIFKEDITSNVLGTKTELRVREKIQ
jgi:hypothetical protein